MKTSNAVAVTTDWLSDSLIAQKSLKAAGYCSIWGKFTKLQVFGLQNAKERPSRRPFVFVGFIRHQSRSGQL